MNLSTSSIIAAFFVFIFPSVCVSACLSIACCKVQSVREVNEENGKRFMFEIIMNNGKRKMLVSLTLWLDCCDLTRMIKPFLSVCACICVYLGSKDSRSQTRMGWTSLASNASVQLSNVRLQSRTVSRTSSEKNRAKITSSVIFIRLNFRKHSPFLFSSAMKYISIKRALSTVHPSPYTVTVKWSPPPRPCLGLQATFTVSSGAVTPPHTHLGGWTVRRPRTWTTSQPLTTSATMVIVKLKCWNLELSCTCRFTDADSVFRRDCWQLWDEQWSGGRWRLWCFTS